MEVGQHLVVQDRPRDVPHRGAAESEQRGRQLCARCLKPKVVCICETLPRVANRTRIFILQHPRERSHAFGTVRFARLSLQNVEVHVAPPRDGPAALGADLPAATGLLYPHEDAADLATTPANRRPKHLLLLDGTWSHAKRLYQANPWLAALPHYRVRPSRPGTYQIRREPREECLSTVEAIVTALRVLEPETEGLDALMNAFLSMVQTQIDYARRDQPRTRRRRRSARRTLPSQLLEAGERLLLAYAEPAPGALGGASPRLACLAACRPASEETFFVVGADSARESRKLRYLELEKSILSKAVQPEELIERWLRFCSADDLIVSWSQQSLRLFPGRARRLSLKHLYCNVTRRSAGHLEELVARHHLPWPEVVLPGRAGRRLAATLAVLRFLKTAAEHSQSGELETKGGWREQ